MALLSSSMLFCFATTSILSYQSLQYNGLGVESNLSGQQIIGTSYSS